jgi:hypothetical protein
MSSIQIGALVYFTLIAIGAWIFFAIIFLQLKRFADMSCHVPLVSKILAITLIALTVFGYVVIFSPSMYKIFEDSASETSGRTSGYFDTY